MTLSELIAQREALERQIQDAQTLAKRDALMRIQRLMAEHHLTTADLLSGPSVKSQGIIRKKVAPKYRDPISGATWTGRGLKPKWLAAALTAGRSISDFTIQSN